MWRFFSARAWCLWWREDDLTVTLL
jgi:hypothetical protein